MAKRNLFGFDKNNVHQWLMPLLSIVVLVLCALVMVKVKSCENYEKYSQMPGYAPPSVEGKYSGPWNTDLCKSAFNTFGYSEKKQKNALRNSTNPSYSDFPMHFCAGQNPDDAGLSCAMIPAAGTDALGSATCQAGFGVAYTPEQCENPMTSTGQMYCTDGGFYDCDRVCGNYNIPPDVVDPSSNIWGFDHVCGSVAKTTPGLMDCPVGAKPRLRSGKAGMNLSTTQISSIAVIFSLLALGVVMALIFEWRKKRK